MHVATFLHEQHVPFDTLRHRTTFTAQQMAQTLDVPGDNVAKAVVLKIPGEYLLAVLQATHVVELSKIRDLLGVESVELASEDEMCELFNDCETGAVPPFGSKYGLRTLVDESLTHDEHIVFDGNTHDEAIYMRYQDYARLEVPRVASFTRHV
jgi:Ala-tRNA(Pro) deacylase